MKVLVSIVVVAATGTAFAQPKIPTRAVPCLPDDPQLTADAKGAPVICWDKGCMKVDSLSDSYTPIARPTPAKPWLLPVANVTADSVCLGTTCKKLGKKLVAKIAQAKKDATDTPLELQATTDLKVVVVGNEPWSVTGDRVLKLGGAKQPSPADTPSLISVTVAGKLLLGDWSACAGPCTTMLVYDSDGRAKGPERIGGGTLIQLDAKRFVVVGEYATVQAFDLETGKHRSTLKLDGEPSEVRSVRLDNGELAVLYKPMDSDMHVLVSITYSDETNALSKGKLNSLPSCTP